MTLLEVSDPARAVFLRLRDRMRLFVTTSTDFDTAELREVKALGQLYVDKSNKRSPDDFARDLGALTRADECGPCPRAVHCPGAYVAAKANVFGVDDARTRELLRGLTGDVLDIGAGEVPYAAELAPAVVSGRARYLALDPDAQRLNLASRALPWLEACVGSWDAVDERRHFRHVLFLRSLNHLPDPDQALAFAVSRLETGGSLLLIDDVAFGLIRSSEQAARAEGGGADFEHHRNDGAEATAARVAALPLRLLERRDVRPGGSNQWLLRYEKLEVRE